MTEHILVADDDEEMRNILTYKLETSYDVTALPDGEACWEYLEEHVDDPPDLIVLDIMMPGMDGFRVLDRIGDHERLAEVPVLMLTSRDGEDDVVRALDAGATDFMTKPFSPNELVARIKRTIE